jgi:hypothetical protein
MRKQTNMLSPSPKGFQSPKISDSDFREVRGLGLGRPKSSGQGNLYNILAKPLCSVCAVSPPKPAGLDPPNIFRHTLNWLRNTNSQKKLKKKFHRKVSKFFYFLFFFSQIFLVKFFYEIAERSVA